MNEITKPNILIVDDRPDNLLALEKILERPDMEIMKATSGNEALAMVLEHRFALVLLDVQMPDMDGFETAELMRENEETKNIPIIFLTALNKEQKFIFKGYEAGAVDYLFKPLEPDILNSKVNVFINLDRQNKQLLDITCELHETVVKLQVSNETIEKQNKLLKDISIHDELTGLYNRHFLTETLNSEFNRTLRYKTDLTCLLLDLDFFKSVNDDFGHDFGDFVLCRVARCLEQNIRKQDIAFRYGGEEFMILLPNTSTNGALSLAEKIRSTSEKTMHNKGTNSTTVTVSIGLASVKQHQPLDGKNLISIADKALYRAKAEGRNRVKVYMDIEEPLKTTEDSVSSEDRNIKYLRESIASVLEKTKKSSLESLELLVRDIGGNKYKIHSHEVKRYIDLIGEKLLLTPSTIETFKRVVTLHDNFKILLEDKISGNGSVLEERERSELENHPYVMAELTGLFDFFCEERSVLMYHHENFDGTGYPEGRSYNEIPIGARIFAIADATAAMLSERPHRKGLSHEKVIEELADNAGNQFDPMMITMFFDVIEEKKLLNVSEETLKKAKEKVRKIIYRNINPE